MHLILVMSFVMPLFLGGEDALEREHEKSILPTSSENTAFNTALPTHLETPFALSRGSCVHQVIESRAIHHTTVG
jgi:hypothetical protein